MEKRGVAEAIIKCQNNTVGKVRCPYCYCIHQHGLAGMKTLAGQIRESHCFKGEYVMVPKK